jgi:hypothetical protein
MITVDVNRNSLDQWQAGISRRFRKNLEDAQSQIRQLWIQELYRQQKSRGDGTWALLNPIYAKRKAREYASNENKDVRYNSILRRTGKMLDGYAKGVQFETTNSRVSVIMPFPSDDARVNLRARSHQGDIGQPRGIPIRAFDIEKFKEIALDKFNEAMRKAANNE